MKTILLKWTLCLVALLLPLSNSVYAQTDTPDGFNGPTWYKFRDTSFSTDGKGSFDNPIVVSSPEQLAQLAWMVNEEGNKFEGQVVVLDADIDLKKEDAGQRVSWIPIGRDLNRSFNGIFMGVNPHKDGWEKGTHKISNMYLSASNSTYTDHYGLFGISWGFIGYLAMDNVTINVAGRTSSDVGCLCGRLSGYEDRSLVSAYESGKRLTAPRAIYAVSVTNATMNVSQMADAGGIVGTITSYGVARSAFEGEMTASSVQQIGGIAGFLNTSVEAFDCAAKVNIKGGTNMGGIVGKTAQRAIIEACASAGNLTDGSRVGGICGQLLANAKIRGCSSSANVSGSERIGGIVGFGGESDAAVSGTYAEIAECLFTGHIRPTGNSYFAGGICGALQWTATQYIDDCLFAGRIDDPAKRKDTEYFGLILGKNDEPKTTVASCYIDQSIAGTGKVSGKADSIASVEFLTTQQLITGDEHDTPLLAKSQQGNRGFQYQPGFYPRVCSNAGWAGLGQFRASGCSEPCRKLFHAPDWTDVNTVYLAQSWLCSVPVVIRKGDCALDFVSTAEVKRTSATFDLPDAGQVKLRTNCLYPESSLVSVKDDVVTALEKGQYTLTLIATETLPASFKLPKAPQAVKELQLDIILSEWDGTVATACAAGTGKAEDPYVIKNGAQLAYAVKNNKASEFYEQICDITLLENLHDKIGHTVEIRVWLDEKDDAPSWKANYDGTGHFVKGACINKQGCGLFGNIDVTGSVSNLGIIDARAGYQGGVFAGTMDGTITNCIVQGEVSGATINGSAYYQAGGICSIVGKDNDEALVEDCITAVTNGMYTYADYTPFVRLSNDHKGVVRNCLTVVPITHLDANYRNSDITASGKSYIKDCYWLKGYEEVPSGYTLEEISEQLGKRSLWKTTQGYFPTLKTFADTDIAKLLMVPFRTDIDYVYDDDKQESDNYLLAMGRQILFEPGTAVWTTTNLKGTFLEADTDMGVVVPVRESYDYNNPHEDLFSRIMPGIAYLTGQLGNAKHYVPVRSRRGNVNAGFSFEDENARAVCLAAFDTNHDNVLSLAELKAATNEQMAAALQTETARKIKTFPEFRFFKNVTELTSQLNRLSNLEKVKLPYALQTIGAEAFKGCTVLKEVTVPSRLTTVKPGAFYQSSVKDILVDPFSEGFVSRDGVLFTKTDGLVAYPNGRTGEEATVGGTISSIAAGAFYKVPDLQKLFFDTTDYNTVPQLSEGGLVTDDGSLMDVYVSDATYDRVLLNGYLDEPSWAPYVNAKKLHQYFPLKITTDVVAEPYGDRTEYYVGTFYIGFPTQLPQELTPFVVNSIKEYEYKAYYHDKSRLVPALQPVIVIAKEPGTYRLTPVEGELERWPAFANQLIGVGRDGMPVNQGNSEQGSIMTLQMDADDNAAFLYEKKSEIAPYHCYLPFPTIDRPAELVKNAHYDLVYAGNTSSETVEKDGFLFLVKTLLPDNERFATLWSYSGSGGNIKVPDMLDDGTPVTQIRPNVFFSGNSVITSIDMTEMDNLEAFDGDRNVNEDKPLSGLSSQVYVYLQAGKTTPAPNTILTDECSELQLYDGWDFCPPYDFHADKVTYDRVLRAIDNGDGTWTSKASTICLPYDLDLTEQRDAGKIRVCELYFIKDNKEFIFSNTDPHLKAGHPYLIVVEEGELSLNAEDVIAVSEADEGREVYDWDDGDESAVLGTWKGTLRKIESADAAALFAYSLQTDGYFKRIRPDTPWAWWGAFRAMFSANEFTGNNVYKAVFKQWIAGDEEDPIVNFPSGGFEGDTDIPDDETGIMHVINNDGTHQYFDLQGRNLGESKPTQTGVYIYNGKKIVIR